jgi:hypothetical protein
VVECCAFERKEISMTTFYLQRAGTTAAALALVALLSTGAALAQGKSHKVDCDKTPDSADCVKQPQAAHQGTATTPGVTPIQPAQPPATGQLPASDQPSGGSNKPGHGGKGG